MELREREGWVGHLDGGVGGLEMSDRFPGRLCGLGGDKREDWALGTPMCKGRT